MPDIGYASGTSHKEGIMTTNQGSYPAQYPVQFAVEYPDRPLNRLTSFFRIFVIIPIAIVLGAVSGATWESAGSTSTLHHSTTYYGPAGAGGLLFFGPLLMILFRQKYPRWWFDWNLELQRFINRVWTYLALMNDNYPSTDDRQWVQLDYAYPDAATGVHSGVSATCRFHAASRSPAGSGGSQGLPARAALTESRAVSPWAVAESR